MSPRPSPEDARQSLNAHVADKGAEIHAKYGPHIGWQQLQKILQDRACVRYPCELVFDAGPLSPGEMAFPQPKGERPEDGFTLFVHPYFQLQPDRIAHIVLYQLVLVNYGEFASSDDAEAFAAGALGMEIEDYYQALCSLADEIGEGAEGEPH